MTGLRTIVFDLDDTLLETGPAYVRVLAAFADIVTAEVPGVARQDVLDRQEEIDLRLVKDQGFLRDRFPASLVETYREMTSPRGLRMDANVATRLWDLGQSVFDSVPPLLPGARALLDELLPHFELLLYTLGAPDVQGVKVQHHGLQHVFREVHVVPLKSAAVLGGVLGERPPRSVLVVGDSLRGEVGPALELGCHAVWLRRATTWRYHHATVQGSYDEIDDIRDLRLLLKRGFHDRTVSVPAS